MAYKRVLSIISALFFLNITLLAQQQPKDTAKYLPYYLQTNPFMKNVPDQKLSPLYNRNIIYDPNLGFIISNTYDSLSFGTPYFMDFDDYINYENNKAFYDIWHKKMLMNRGTAQNNMFGDILSPNINTGIKGMETIFGSDQVSLRPTGAIGLTFGLAYNKVYNPALPPELRGRYPTFIFNQDIQLGIVGKIGEKFNVGINYNTNTMFDFQDKKKVEYTGDEDEIIQSIEAGDVMFNTPNTLIQGSTTLFGLKSVLKFGHLTVESVLSHKKGQAKTIEIKGGAVLTDFEVRSSDYEADKHFFLNHYFRDIYQQNLANLPIVTSPVKITRVEVWVTNKTSDFENARNIVAFQDLGEGDPYIYATGFVTDNPQNKYPSNDKNNLYENLTTNYSSIRDIASASTTLGAIPNFTEGVDYIKLENARKLSENDYTINYDLGYISLNFNLRPGEVLAVAYEYTVNGEVYQVGEFSNDVKAPQTLILKLLRGPASVPSLPMWDLMMKNIYSLDRWNISKEDFVLDIFYNDDRTGNQINYIPEGDIKNTPLLRVFNFDRADNQNNPNPDGYFDFIEGITIDSKHGYIIFPELEPFGDYLAEKIGDPKIAEKYAYTELYDSTQYAAKQIAVKNKFYLRGHYKSSSGAEVMLNVMNIPQGSVRVTQGGRELVENQDYTVDYNVGKVTIINKSLLMSGIPIKVSLESHDMYGITTQNFTGLHLNYEFNKDFSLGATYEHLTERPIDVKTPFGSEPYSNTMLGFNTSYSTDVPFLTKMVDMLPFVETKTMSHLDFNAEFARLIPGSPKILGQKAESFIDDFEDSQSYIDLKAPLSWKLASIPQFQTDKFPEASDVSGVTSNFNRALLAWYDISTDFTNRYSSTRPANISYEDVASNHLTRDILETEIYSNRQPYGNTPARLTVLNLAYYPDERGPYNFDVEGLPGVSAGIDQNGKLKNPQTRWGGIMHDLYVNDFESSNIEFIEFWLMDPFVYDSLSAGGNLYIDLGNISEDILHDSRKSFENGIPYPDDPTKVDTTQWGIVSRQQMTTQNFDNNPDVRRRQDAGLDGILDETEQSFFNDYLNRIAQLYGTNSQAYQNAVLDPSNDDFKYFLDPTYDQVEADVLDRYKRFNGTEGNSPIAETGTNTYQAVSFQPDMEDINRDNTLDTYEGYYQYDIALKPDEMEVGKNYIVNKIRAKVKLANGEESYVNWYQFRIPVRQPDEVHGNIDGFKSIRFIRMFLRGWQTPVVLRFAEYRLVREEWRTFEGNLLEGAEATTVPEPTSNATMNISVVNIEESAQKEPVNYILPPGVTREQDPFNEQLRQLNEQSLALTVQNLDDGEAKAIYKLVSMDLRRYKRIKMFVHAEALPGEEDLLHDKDVTLFIRLGSDFTHNFYEYEIPLKLTPAGYYYSADNAKEDPTRYIVWPLENELDLALQTLLDAKQKRNVLMREPGSNIKYSTPFVVYDGDRKITVLGNPNLSNVRVVMIGIRNPRAATNVNEDDGQPKSVEVWVNELRLSDFNDGGGWAADARMNLNLADFANVTMSAYTHTPGFGSIEQRVNERYRDQVIQYDLSTRVQMGKFFPKKAGVSIPVYWGYSEIISNPEYNPLDPDIKLSTALSNPNLTPEEINDLKKVSQTYVRRKSFNVTNVRVQGQKNTSKKKKSKVKPFYHISNFTTSVAYNEVYQRSPTVEFDIQQNLMLSAAYNYAPNPPNIKPFRKVKLFRKKYFRLIRDFNFYYLPQRVNISAEVDRQYNTYKSRNLDPNLDVKLPTLYQKNFNWRRNYDFSYRLSRSMKIDFSARSQARVEPQGWVYGDDWFSRMHLWDNQDTIFLYLYDFGRSTEYNHNLRATWRVPVNKLPLLGWTSLDLSYNINYSWLRGQDPYNVTTGNAQQDYVINFGNTIQNSQVFKANARLNFTSLYNSIKFLRDIDRRFTSKGRKPRQKGEKEVTYQTQVRRLYKKGTKYITHKLKTESISSVKVVDGDGKKVPVSYEVVDKNRIRIVSSRDAKDVTITVVGRRKEKEGPVEIASDYFFRTLMFMRSASVSYKINGGSLVNGFMPESDILGMQKINDMWAPGWDFIGGVQNPGFIEQASRFGWITTDSLFNKPFVYTNAEDLRVRLSVEPINNFRIDFNFQRNYSYKNTEYGYATEDGNFYQNSRMITGNFFISINTIRTAFEKYDPINYESESYRNFLEYRSVIASRLASERRSLDADYNPGVVIDSVTGAEFPEGYGPASQQVLIPALIAAYTGVSPSDVDLNPFLKIPLPDWRINYDGLGNLPFIKNFTKRFTIMHAYVSTYTVNNYQSNPSFDYDFFNTFGYTNLTYNSTGDFVPQYEIGGVSISEKFVPLLGINAQFKNNFSIRTEYKKTREIYLSMSNTQIRERHSNSFTFGAGYIIPDVKFVMNTGNGPQTVKSDLNLRLDITSEHSYEYYRRIVEGISQLNLEKTSFILTATADYNINDKVSVQVYYNHNLMESNTAPKTLNLEGGFRIRVALAQ